MNPSASTATQQTPTVPAELEPLRDKLVAEVEALKAFAKDGHWAEAETQLVFPEPIQTIILHTWHKMDKNKSTYTWQLAWMYNGESQDHVIAAARRHFNPAATRKPQLIITSIPGINALLAYLWETQFVNDEARKLATQLLWENREAMLLEGSWGPVSVPAAFPDGELPIAEGIVIEVDGEPLYDGYYANPDAVPTIGPEGVQPIDDGKWPVEARVVKD